MGLLADMDAVVSMKPTAVQPLVDKFYDQLGMYETVFVADAEGISIAQSAVGRRWT